MKIFPEIEWAFMLSYNWLFAVECGWMFSFWFKIQCDEGLAKLTQWQCKEWIKSSGWCKAV